MPTVYPGSLDTLTNPTAADTLAAVPHDSQHATANDAIEALEAKVGTGTSTPVTPGHVLKVTGVGATAYGTLSADDISGSIGSAYIDVTDYGAIGNGVANDTAAVQSAIDAAESAGKGVYFPAGTYAVSSLTVPQAVSLVGAGRESSILAANTDFINIVTITGTTQRSTMEVDFASTVVGLGFDANGRSGCEGVAYVGVAYFSIERCTFDGFDIGVDFFGSLQGRVLDTKFLSNVVGISYTAEPIGYYVSLPAIPPNRVLVDWCTFYYNSTHAIDYSEGQQLIIEHSEFGDNGTFGNAATSAIKVRMAGDAGGAGLVARGLWLESNHGLAVLDLGGTSIGQHSISDLWLAYNDSTYSIALDGSTAAQTLVARNVRHDQVVSPATVSTWRSVGGTTTLDATDCDGSLSGTWTRSRQSPLLSGAYVDDLSEWDALRLPVLTTGERDAIASPTEGMVIWNTTTNAVNQYNGSAWEAVASGSGAGTELAYAEFTSPVTLTALNEATANSIVSAGAVSFDGSTTVVIEGYIPSVTNDNATANTRFWLYDGSSSIGEIGRTTNPAAGTAPVGMPVTLKRRLTPSNASHTYSIRGSSNGGAGAGAGAGGAGNLMPGYIRITKV